MRFFLLALLLSLSLLSCDNDNQKEVKEVDKTEAIKSINKPISTVESNKEEPKYKLGEHYFELPVPYDTKNKTNVVVYEFFGYTCPHCFHFEPFVNKWAESKPDHVLLKRVPLNFQPAWDIFQQAYLTAETMGVIEKTHNKLFAALHEDHKRFHTIEELAQWYDDEVNIDKAVFLSTAESFILDSAQRKADSMGFKMQIKGTPTLVVNGKYKVSTKIGDRDEVINIMKFLIDKEANAMGLLAP